MKALLLLDAGGFRVADAVTAILSLDEAPSILAEWSANPRGLHRILIQM